MLLALGVAVSAPVVPIDPGAVMTIGRLHYDGGGDWYANPSSLPNLLSAIKTRTTLRVAMEEKVVTLSDDDLWNVPYLYMTGHGNVHWSDRDLATLRRYLQQGGFLHADDNYGMDQSIRRGVLAQHQQQSRKGKNDARMVIHGPAVAVMVTAMTCWTPKSAATDNAAGA